MRTKMWPSSKLNISSPGKNSIFWYIQKYHCYINYKTICFRSSKKMKLIQRELSLWFWFLQHLTLNNNSYLISLCCAVCFQNVLSTSAHALQQRAKAIRHASARAHISPPQVDRSLNNMRWLLCDGKNAHEMLFLSRSPLHHHISSRKRADA